ncbi:MAG: 30S ribosomal protein S27ae [Methanosphaera stadtmanae]|jgi:small subunit ribosomal protein S27Ae|nr:30S ribosomal protein S27ae [Methanosphaera stadtmanae]
MSKKYELYEVKDGKIERKNPVCERCGHGIFMADHGDRYACGRCGFTQWKNE